MQVVDAVVGRDGRSRMRRENSHFEPGNGEIIAEKTVIVKGTVVPWSRVECCQDGLKPAENGVAHRTMPAVGVAAVVGAGAVADLGQQTDGEAEEGSKAERHVVSVSLVGPQLVAAGQSPPITPTNWMGLSYHGLAVWPSSGQPRFA